MGGAKTDTWAWLRLAGGWSQTWLVYRIWAVCDVSVLDLRTLEPLTPELQLVSLDLEARFPQITPAAPPRRGG